jgi:hypothetical protein
LCCYSWVGGNAAFHSSLSWCHLHRRMFGLGWVCVSASQNFGTSFFLGSDHDFIIWSWRIFAID